MLDLSETETAIANAFPDAPPQIARAEREFEKLKKPAENLVLFCF